MTEAPAKSLAAAGLGLAVFLSPWSAGSIRPAAFHLIGLCVALSALWLGLSDRSLWGHHSDVVPPRNVRLPIPFLAGFLLLISWTLFQTIPLPADLLTLVSPKAHQIHSQASALWGHHSDGVPPAFPISLAPGRTREQAAKLATLALAFAATALLSAEPRLRNALAWVLPATALLVSALGLLLLAKGFCFGLLPARHHVGLAIGPFANHNHFADFIAAPGLLGLGLVADRSRARRILGAGALGILGLGLLASGSRAGLLAAVIGTLFYLFSFVSAHPCPARAGKAKTAVALLAALLFLTFRPAFSFARLESLKEDFLQVRWPIWNSTLLMIGDFPWTGAGAGSFAEVEPAYSILRVPAPAGHAHCDYLEWLAESGAPMMLIAALAFGLGFSGLMKQAARWDRITRGALAGILILLVHAGVDFSFQIPAVALSAAVLLGLAASFPPAPNGWPERRRPAGEVKAS